MPMAAKFEAENNLHLDFVYLVLYRKYPKVRQFGYGYHYIKIYM